MVMDKNGIELTVGDYVKIVTVVRHVGVDKISVVVGGEVVFVDGDRVEVVHSKLNETE